MIFEVAMLRICM